MELINEFNAEVNHGPLFDMEDLKTIVPAEEASVAVAAAEPPPPSTKPITEQSLRRAEEISAALATPLLGVVRRTGNGALLVDRGRLVSHDSKSPVAEAYRMIRTAVCLGNPDGEAKTLLVTSPGTAEGKTTAVSNLATVMAQAGQRTLVLDADFRNSRQHKIFGVGNKVGLADLLAPSSSVDEVIQRTRLENLDILPCGCVLSDPSKMLHRQARVLEVVLGQLCKRYEHIVIDSPSVLPVTDARILGAMCDATLLVLRADRFTRQTAEESREILSVLGAKILGVVVNDVTPESEQVAVAAAAFADLRP